MGGHTWPGSLFAGTGTNQDINASEEIWKFFSRYDINGLTNVLKEPLKNNVLKIYPNPTSSVINVEVKNYKQDQKYILSDIAGKVIKRAIISSNKSQIDISKLSSGIYYLNINNKFHKIIKSQ